MIRNPDNKDVKIIDVKCWGENNEKKNVEHFVLFVENLINVTGVE